jgi:multiple sugar transport system substrate-binding protein
MKRKIYFYSILCLLFLTIIITTGCKGGSPEAKKAYQPVTLNYWRVFDDSFTLEPLIQAYRTSHPNISIVYKKFRYEEYEDELLNAMAEDRGPDIFSIHNTWFLKYLSKIESCPQLITLPYKFIKGTIKKETYIEFRSVKGFTPQEIYNEYAPQVHKDVVINNQVYGVPLGFDVLALFYNRDILNKAGIPKPAVTWTQFQEHVRKMTRYDSDNKIIRAGAAMGTASNVDRSSDILSLLMMQNGTDMIVDGEVLIEKTPERLKERTMPPGVEALRFYTDFANPTKDVYTWNKDLEISPQYFAKGKLGYLLGYSYHIPIIKAQNPNLRFGITKAPQIQQDGRIDFANYYAEVVSKKTEHKNEAWDFIRFITDPENVKIYLEAAGKPPARKDLFLEYSSDIRMEPFVSMSLSAQSWYRGYKPVVAEQLMKEMISLALNGQKPLSEIVTNTSSKIQQTLNSLIIE